MRANDLLSLAWVSLMRNKLRSSLTALGVTVGVFALTTIIAMGQGLERSIIDQLTDDEDQARIVVRPGFGKRERKIEVVGVDDPIKADRLRKAIAKRRRGAPSQMRRTQLTVEALKAMRDIPNVKQVRPLAIDRFKITFGEHTLDGALSLGIEPGSARWNARVIAGDPFHAKPRGVWIHEYRLYSWGYRTDAQQSALIGKTVLLSRPREMANIASYLAMARAYGVDIPVDANKMEKWVRMFRPQKKKKKNEPPAGTNGAQDPKNNQLSIELPIAGVIRERIEEDRFDLWEDSISMQTDLFLPQKIAEELFEQVPSNRTRGYNAAAVQVSAPVQVKPVEKALRDEGFRTVSVGSILERLGKALAILTAVVSGLTAIALVVAMLGIVNTMVMNVSERTREIGVFKALGATDGQVRGLFLVESALIGLAGGVLGVVLSLGASIPGDYLTQQKILEMTHYRYDGSIFHFPAWLLALAMAFAVILSVLAALGPSTRASRVDPVSALRDE